MQYNDPFGDEQKFHEFTIPSILCRSITQTLLCAKIPLLLPPNVTTDGMNDTAEIYIENANMCRILSGFVHVLDEFEREADLDAQQDASVDDSCF